MEERHENRPALVKAALAHIDTLESIEVLWNPARYHVKRESRLRGARLGGGGLHPLQVAGREERFRTDLFLDTTEEAPGPRRDAGVIARRLAAWMASPGTRAAPRVVFVWGPFRFAGAIEELEEEWLRFDPDGTPVRAWLRVTLRRT